MLNAHGAVISVIQIIDQIVNIGKKVQQANDFSATRSLIDVTKLARVEPLTIVSSDCLTLEYLPDIMQTLLSIFAGYYMQAVAIGARVDSIKVIRTLDRLNPDRDGSGNYFMTGMEGMKDMVGIAEEAYTHRLPTSMNRRALESEQTRVGTRKDWADRNTSGTGTIENNDVAKTLVELSNLAVGKLVNIEIGTNESAGVDADGNKLVKNKKVTIPVSIRLVPASVSNRSISHILTLKAEDTTLVERFHAWRAGRIGFVKDLILCQDIIDEHKKALMNDESGVYSEIIRRVNNAKKFGLLSGNPSMVSASNLFVISESVAHEVEMKLGGKLSNARIRQKAFENTYAMIIVVVDREWERVTFYHRGIAMATEVSLRDIKISAKSKGPDIMDLLKAFQQGNAPSF